ncbi:MAG: arginine decarboxylase, pyruvoyl-dependent [Candidatus Aminicenantes bacterium]|jgi:arginine decarboxylase
MNMIVPTKIFLTKGMGQHKEKLTSLEIALREACIAPYNLVKITSIFPPHCSLIPREEGIKLLRPGQILFLVMSDIATNEGQRLITASIGLAMPNDPSHYGYLSEHHAYGMKEREAGEYAADLAADMLATTLGKDFNTREIWQEEKNHYNLSSSVSVSTRSIVQSAEGKKGLWTTALAAAVCLP